MRHLQLYLIAALSLALYASGTARAEPPSLMPIQGVLTDADGGLIDGEVSVTFRLYDAETEGDVLHEETQTVPVMRGRFVVYLGTEADLDLEIFRDNADVFLGIAVEEDAEASPRLRLATAPYAASAAFCSEANLLSGMEADDFAPADHTHPPENAATLCDDDEYLDGDGDCKPIPVDTNAATLCNDGEYLDGDGACKSVSTMTDTNAETICADDLYLRGDGSCQPMTVDTTVDQGTVEGWARGVCYDTEGELTGLLDDNYVNEGQANSVDSAMVVANSLTAADLAPNSVGSSEMADNAIGSAEVVNGSLTYSDTNVDSIQRRVTGTCPGGSAIQSIASNGTVGCTPRISFSAYANAANTVTQSGGYINFQVEVWDDANAYDPSNGRFTAPVAGVYHFDAHLRMDGHASAGNYMWIALYRNTTLEKDMTSQSSTDTFGIAISADLLLSAGDYVRVYLDPGNIAGSYDTQSGTMNTWFNGHLVQ